MLKILLASESYLKNFILEKTRLNYDAVPANIDESVFDELEIGRRVVMLAEKKAEVVAKSNPQSIVISADTLTTDPDGNVYNKLTGSGDPFKAALDLSGKTIQIYTGCCVYEPSIGYASKLVMSSIKYTEFTEETLRRVIEGDDASIRSGSLGIFYDAPGFTLIEHIEGSYTGSFGMPMEFVYEQLDHINKLKTNPTTI